MTVSKSLFLLLLICNISVAQTQFVLHGCFPQAQNKEIQLRGFTMKIDTLFSKTNTDKEGNFSLSYPAIYVGTASIAIKESKSVLVLLNHENFEMQWDNLEDFKSLHFKNSLENDAFGKGIVVVQRSESLLSGLRYLKPLYVEELQESKKGKESAKRVKWITEEIATRGKAFSNYLHSLPVTSYAVYYLRLRKFLQDLHVTGAGSIDRLPEQEATFKSMDFVDIRLLQSGLYKELLDGYFQLLEQQGNLDSVYEHINTSTDALLKSLQANPELKQDVAEYLFKMFEKRSLFKASEHIALAMLSSESCQVESKQQVLYEQYRKMAVGNMAPELRFENTKASFAKLSELKNKYKLVVFGSSWCPTCAEEIPKLKSYYTNWKKEYDLEIVLVSLDVDKEKYEAFTHFFPWVSTCDFQSWEGKNARDYCVVATPTYYLLDENNTIVLKPVSAEQINAWLTLRKKK